MTPSQDDIVDIDSLSDHSDMEEMPSLGLGSFLNAAPSVALEVPQFDVDELFGFLKPSEENFFEMLAEEEVKKEEKKEEETEEKKEEEEEEEQRKENEGGDQEILHGEYLQDNTDNNMELQQLQNQETPNHCRPEDNDDDCDVRDEEEATLAMQKEAEEELDSVLDVTGDVDLEYSWTPMLASTPRSDTTAAYEWDIASQSATKSVEARNKTIEPIDVTGDVDLEHSWTPMLPSTPKSDTTAAYEWDIASQSATKSVEARNKTIEPIDVTGDVDLEHSWTPMLASTPRSDTTAAYEWDIGQAANMYDSVKNRKRSCVVLQETSPEKPKAKRRKRQKKKSGAKPKKTTTVSDRARQAGLLPKSKS